MIVVVLERESRRIIRTDREEPVGNRKARPERVERGIARRERVEILVEVIARPIELDRRDSAAVTGRGCLR